ncbi:MAG: hypothetical protein PHP54_04610 [Clostridia bacterium]|nr:hypothetical protein [Clostridia bacterium]
MNKKMIILVVISVIVIGLAALMVYSIRAISFSEQSDVKRVYNNESNISNIQIEVNNIAENKKTKIENKEDIELILNKVKGVMIKKINPRDALLGGYARLIITNKNTGISIHVNIGSSQIGIEDKQYRIDENVLDKIKEMINKYDNQAIL